MAIKKKELLLIYQSMEQFSSVRHMASVWGLVVKKGSVTEGMIKDGTPSAPNGFHLAGAVLLKQCTQFLRVF